MCPFCSSKSGKEAYMKIAPSGFWSTDGLLVLPRRFADEMRLALYGCGSKFNRRGYGFGPCVHLPGFHFGAGFLSHSHVASNRFDGACGPTQRSMFSVPRLSDQPRGPFEIGTFSSNRPLACRFSRLPFFSPTDESFGVSTQIGSGWSGAALM